MYKIFKTIKKTAKENKLIQPENCNFLVDLSLLNEMNIREEDYKDIVQELVHLSPAFNELFPMKVDDFHAYHARLKFQCYRVFATKALYCIYELKYVFYSCGDRKGIYETKYEDNMKVMKSGNENEVSYPIEHELPLKKAILSVKALYDTLGETLSYGKVICHTSENDNHRYVLMDAVGNILCMDGERCDILEDGKNRIKLRNAGSETAIVFRLTEKEREVAIYA